MRGAVRRRVGPAAVAGAVTSLWAVAITTRSWWVSLLLAVVVLVATYLGARLIYEAGWTDGIRGERR